MYILHVHDVTDPYPKNKSFIFVACPKSMGIIINLSFYVAEPPKIYM